MDWYIWLGLGLIAVIAGIVLFVSRGRPEVERPGKLPKRERPQSIGAGRSGGIAKRTAGPNINVPVDISPAPVPAEPPKEPNGPPEGQFIPAGSKWDKTGDPVLARRVSLLRSTNRIIPDNKLFSPGDEVLFEARIVDEQSAPLEGVPVFWRINVQRRDLSFPVQTDKDGVATAVYTVTQEDMVPAGSYMVHCYAGGRALIQKAILHDSVFLPGEEPKTE